MSTFTDFKIDIGSRTGVEVRALCPQCSVKRKNSSAKCLAVNTEKGTWICHHCDWRGGLKSGQEQPSKKIIVRPDWVPPLAPTAILLEWFAARGITRETLEQEQVTVLEHYMAQVESYVPAFM